MSEPTQKDVDQSVDTSNKNPPQTGLHRSIMKMTDDELKRQSEIFEDDRTSDESDDMSQLETQKTQQSTDQNTVKEVRTKESEKTVEKPAQNDTSKDHSNSSSFVKIRKWFSFNKDGNNNAQNSQMIAKLNRAESFNLALSRYKENDAALQSQSEKDRQAVDTCANNLRKTFNEIKTGIEVSHDEMLIKGIDWEFWSDVVNDYSKIVCENPEELRKHVSGGIPRELRGMIWQLICNSKSPQLEEFYRDERNRSSSYEKAIKRDLSRTSFVTNGEVQAKMMDLFDIIKCYSLYDTAVGYTQGMAFLTVPLLMNMDASEAFCMLVKLMDNYSFRDLYLPEMPGLHLMLYQFDRLLEDMLPDLYFHLQQQDIKSSMYATQWFLTLFGYKFPLDMVLRIYDIVIAEGMESILRFALNLMLQNKEKMMELQFDDLLKFLKEKIFYCYQQEGDKITASNYKLDEFVSDSMKVQILPITLSRYQAEFEEIKTLESRRKHEIDQLRLQNSGLLKEIRKIEAAYATLNKEHVQIANEMVQGKVEIANLEDDNQQLKQQINENTKRLSTLNDQSGKDVDFTGKLSSALDEEVQRTMKANAEVMTKNADLEEKLSILQQQYEELKEQKKHKHKRWLSSGKKFW